MIRQDNTQPKTNVCLGFIIRAPCQTRVRVALSAMKQVRYPAAAVVGYLRIAGKTKPVLSPQI